MSLDPGRFEKPRIRGGKLIARCPACAEFGADQSCEHLFVADRGRGSFGCILHPGSDGDAHRKRIWELIGNRHDSHPGRFLASPKPKCAPVTSKPRIPPLRPLNAAEMAAVAELRGWPSFAGLELLTLRGLLWQGMVWDDNREWPAWIITDGARHNAQARRLDGSPWHGIGNKKAKSLRGSDPTWPIGASAIGARPLIVLCEGGPDFLAGLLVACWEGGPRFAESAAPVCMTGAGNSINANALPFFKNRHVRIAVHDDNKGQEAGERWARQIYDAGASLVDGFDFNGLVWHDGEPVKDLADFATLLDRSGHLSLGIFSDMINFAGGSH